MTSNVWRILVLMSIAAAASCSNRDKNEPSGNVDAGGSQHSDPSIDSPTDAAAGLIGGHRLAARLSWPDAANDCREFELFGIDDHVTDAFALPRIGDVHHTVARLDHRGI